MVRRRCPPTSWLRRWRRSAVAHAPAGGVRRPRGLRVGAGQHLLRVDLRRSRRRPRRGRRSSGRSAPGPNAVLLVRGDDDSERCRAFANTCRHRGHELLACGATAKRRNIVCPYHSWSYRLDGTLRNAPGFRDVDGFDPDEFGLAELRLSNWHGWLFVDPSGPDVDFSRARRRPRRRRRPVSARGPDDRRAALLRARHQLEGDRRELPGVLPLLDHPSRAVPDQPADQRREPRRCRGRGWAAGCRSSTSAETMSLSGKSGGVAIQGLSEHELRTRHVPGRLSRTCWSACTRTTS